MWGPASNGCSVASKPAPVLTVATSQPFGDPEQLAQQLAGQVVAGVQAAVHAELRATGVDYRSEFGIGPVLIVGLALVLTVYLSHRREAMRIAQNGRHRTCPKTH